MKKSNTEENNDLTQGTAKAVEINPAVLEQLGVLVEDVYRLSADMGKVVETMLVEARNNPMSPPEVEELLTKVVTVLREGAQQRNDIDFAASLSGDVSVVVSRVMQARDHLAYTSGKAYGQHARLDLLSRDGVDAAQLVCPVKMFNGKRIQLEQGFVRARDLQLWAENGRLKLHVNEFRKRYDREPTAEDILNIMRTKVALPGAQNIPGISQETKIDQFKIKGLADHIARNGVQRPPILDEDDILIDGNRRLTAVIRILDSEEYNPEDKQRVEFIYIWRLPQNTLPEDRLNIVRALNFGDELKEAWPEFIRIEEVYKSWEEKMQMEPTASDTRRAYFRKRIAQEFDIPIRQVERYIRMMDWADEFVEHHVNNNNLSESEVKLRANRYIQYFDEMSSGKSEGTVGYELTNDPGLKHMVFDLLYEGKFENWKQVRDLKSVFRNKEARAIIERAREAKDIATAGSLLDDAMKAAESKRVNTLAPNTQIEKFNDFMNDLKKETIEQIATENIQKLLSLSAFWEPVLRARVDCQE